MTGQWLIGGAMRVTRVLNDAEVSQINAEHGVSDLPRKVPLDLKALGFGQGSAARSGGARFATGRGEPVSNPDELAQPSGDSGAFDETAYRPAVVAWAKARFGDERAPDGSAAWQNMVKWFGGSQVTDENEEPLTVYHTSFDADQITSFAEGKGKDGDTQRGIELTYFADDELQASLITSAKRKVSAWLKIDSPLDLGRLDVTDEYYPWELEEQLAWHGLSGVTIDESIVSGQRQETPNDNEKIALWEVLRKVNSSKHNIFARMQERGFDGIKTDEANGTWITLHGDQIKSVDNTGAFSPSPDIRFSLSLPPWLGGPPTVLHAGNESIRKANITLWDKAKSQLRRQLSPGGNLPRQVFGLKVDRDSQFEAAEMDIRSLLSHFDRVVQEAYGKAFDKLPVPDQALLGEALRFNDAAAMDQRIPEPVRLEVIKMRQYIDRLSGDYVSILFDEANALLADGKVEQAAQRAVLLTTIANNIGEYVHRSYRAFDDPKWVERVPDQVLNEARAYITARREQQAQKYDRWAAKADARGEADKADRHRGRAAVRRDPARVDKTLRLILTEGKAFDSMEAFVKESKLGQMDLSILKHRKDIAAEIRALLGEYTDPRLNFAKSATKMSRLIWNNLFLKRVLDIGDGEFLFRDKEAAPMAVTRQIAASPAYAPLNGYYTTPEIEEAFRDILGKEEMADWYRAVVQANGLVKFGKTILSPTTAMRNWMSSYFFTVANGHFNMRPMDTAWKAWHEYRLDQDQGRLFAYLRKLKTLGVVYDTPFAGEMMRLLEDARLENKFQPEQWTKVKSAIDVARKFYGFGDDFWKIVGFENEKALLIKYKGMSEADAETAAAERIRNTYPTHGRPVRAKPAPVPAGGVFRLVPG
jgi:hypothetical protein